MARLVSALTLVLALPLVGGGCRSAETTSDDGGGSGGAGGTPEPVDPRPLSVLNWNVHNLVDDENDGAEFEDCPGNGCDPGWENHVTEVASVLTAMDPDIAILQEVEDIEILAAVVAEMSADYVYYELIEANDPRGIDVCVISKLEPDEVITHQEELFSVIGTDTPKFRYSRDALEVRLTFNTRKIALLGVHYKAKEDDDPAKRLAESQHTRVIADAITEADPETGVIILGDFNDTPGSPPYAAGIGEAPAYANAADMVAQADRWTFEFQGTPELVDHQMVSPLMHEKLDASSVRILHSPEAEAASDHAPVIATYDVN